MKIIDPFFCNYNERIRLNDPAETLTKQRQRFRIENFRRLGKSWSVVCGSLGLIGQSASFSVIHGVGEGSQQLSIVLGDLPEHGPSQAPLLDIVDLPVNRFCIVIADEG